MAGEVPGVGPDVLVDRLVNDTDARVRANTIEVLEGGATRIVPLLAQRARAANSRERANAIKALHEDGVGTLTGPLLMMLRDSRGEHRISAMWALRQIGWWQLLDEVGRLAKSDRTCASAATPWASSATWRTWHNHRSWKRSPDRTGRFTMVLAISRHAAPDGLFAVGRLLPRNADAGRGL